MLTELRVEPANSAGDDAQISEPRNFSIILGGPLFQLLCRARMSGDALQLVRRRVIVIAVIAWLPLLLLAAIEGNALGHAVSVPFLKDIEVHARFLISMPLLIVAELVVHQRLRPVAEEFVVRGLVLPEDVERFKAIVRSAMKLRNSVTAELFMVAIVYGVGIPFIWRELAVLDTATWYANDSAHGSQFTWAGRWFAYVSVPVFQFLLLRWYFRLVIWMRFLWQVSRMRLNISAMHADGMAGLGFLAGTAFAFIPLLMAHGALVSGTIANRIFYLNAALADSQIEIAVVVGFLLIIVFGPLSVFAFQVEEAKRIASRVYGRLAQRYVSDFERTWIPGGMPAEASPLGTGDIQSLADLANSMQTVKSTRVVPITRQAVLTLAIATLLPVVPLLLTVIPAKELAKQLLKLVM